MTESFLFTAPLQGELIGAFIFPKGDISSIAYPKGILEELTAEYNLNKPIYIIEPGTGPSYKKPWQVRCTVTDSKNNNTFIVLGDGCCKVRDSEHSAARKILEHLNKIYYFSEEEKPKMITNSTYVMSRQEPTIIKLKLYKWENCCELCYSRGHLKEQCHGVIRNKRFLNNTQKPDENNYDEIDDFWELPSLTKKH